MPYPGRPLRGNEWLTQYVTRDEGTLQARCRPRPKDQGELSMTLGRLTPAQVVAIVRIGVVPTGEDGARYVRVGTLRRAGFIVEHTPNRANPRHVSVRTNASWDDHEAAIFEECLGDPVWHKEEEGGR